MEEDKEGGLKDVRGVGELVNKKIKKLENSLVCCCCSVLSEGWVSKETS